MGRLVLSVLVALALTPALAPAQEQGGTQPLRAGTENLSGWLVLDPGSTAGIGLGARYMFPLVPEGLLAGQGLRVREELALEVGADFIHWSYPWRYYDLALGWRDDRYSVNAVELVAGVMWNWWLTPRLALYPKLDLGYRFAWVSDWPGDPYGMGSPGYSDVFVNGAIGAIFKLRKVALRIEAGNHSLRLGVGVKI